MKLAIVGLLLTATAFADGIPAKDVKMKNVDGKELSIADVAGTKGTLVIFTCNHCPFVKAWETRIAELGNTYREKGIGVIAINANDPTEYAEDSFEEMQSRAKRRGIQYPYVVDSTSNVARAFDAKATPELFLYNAAGKLVYHGGVDDSKDASKVTQHYAKDALDALLAGKEIAIKETKALGCSIKFRPKA
jgi:thiol-disulfide isomerase/thioredoxin